ncbi:MAG: putative Ig domain-containing protein [Planctomycetota bacterium]
MLNGSNIFGGHNFPRPHDVNNDGIVTPLDALVVINALARVSDSGQTSIPISYEDPAAGRDLGYDVSCDARISPLDALLVINTIARGVFPSGLNFETEGGQVRPERDAESSRCFLHLTESDTFLASITSDFVVPPNASHVELELANVNFDLTSNGLANDAIEIAVLDSEGRPLIVPYLDGGDAVLNLTEGFDPQGTPSISVSSRGNVEAITIPLDQLPIGAQASLVVRTINNDNDTGTSFDYLGFEVVTADPAVALQSRQSSTGAVADTTSKSISETFPKTLDSGVRAAPFGENRNNGKVTATNSASRLSSDLDEGESSSITDLAVGELIGGFLSSSADTHSHTVVLNQDGRLFVDPHAADSDDFFWRLSSSGGIEIASGPSTADLRIPGVLPADAYQLQIEQPSGAETTHYQLQVWQFEDSQQDLQLDQVTLGSITTPGATDRYRFYATTGQAFDIDLMRVSGDLVGLRADIRDADNHVVVSFDLDRNDVTLPAAGDYTLNIYSDSGTKRNFGTYAFQVASSSATPRGTLPHDIDVVEFAWTPTVIDNDIFVEITWTVENTGNEVVVLDGTEDRLLITNQVRADRDRRPGLVEFGQKFSINEVLEPGERYTRSAVISDVSTLGGDIQFGVQADVTNQIGEFEETNNYRVSPELFAFPQLAESEPTSTIAIDRPSGPVAAGEEIVLPGRVDLAEATTNTIVIIDVSGSTALTTGIDVDGNGAVDENDNLNGDGRVGDILDAELFAIQSLIESLAEKEGQSIAVVGLARVDSGGRPYSSALDISAHGFRQSFASVTQDTVAELEAAIRSLTHSQRLVAAFSDAGKFHPIRWGGGTDLGLAMSEVERLLSRAPNADQTEVLLFADGSPTSHGEASDEQLRRIADFGVSFRGFQITGDAVSDEMLHVAQTISSHPGSTGQATVVTDPSDLADIVSPSIELAAVRVNGQQGILTDTDGGFLGRVKAELGTNSVQVEAIDTRGNVYATEFTLDAVGSEAPQVEGRTFQDVTASLGEIYGRTSFNSRSDELLLELGASNLGLVEAKAPLLMAVEGISIASVSVIDPDGYFDDGTPYIDLSDHVVDGWLSPGDISETPITVFANPDRMPFSYDIAFYSDVNAAPTFNTLPSVEAFAGQPYEYIFDAADPEGEALSFLLLSAPEDIQFDAASKRITWQPTRQELGRHQFIIQVQDPRGGYSEQVFSLEVRNAVPNRPPVFRSLPDAEILLDDSGLGRFLYVPDVFDADGDQVTVSILDGPDGLELTQSTDEITWSADGSDLGSHTVSLRIDDQQGGITTQTFTLRVLDNAAIGEPRNGSAPYIAISEQVTAVAGSDFQLLFRVQDGQGDISDVSIVDGPAGVTVSQQVRFDANNQATDVYYRLDWSVPQDFNNNDDVVLNATDAEGNSTEVTVQFQAKPATDVNFSPKVTSTPRPTARIDRPWAYVISATDPENEAISYTLTDAPSGAKLSADGVLGWTPTAEDVGVHAIQVLIEDGRRGRTLHSFDLSVVTADSNSPPVLSTLRDAAVITGSDLVIQAAGADPNNDTILYRLQNAPNGMSIDARTGLIHWTPLDSQIGQHQVTVVASDPSLRSNQQQFSVDVFGINVPPSIISTPKTTGFAQQTFVDLPVAIDRERNQLNWNLVSGPNGMTVDSDSGVIFWATDSSHIGTHQVIVSVSDGEQDAEQSYLLEIVDPDLLIDPSNPSLGTVGNRSPSFTSRLPSVFEVGLDTSVEINAVDLDGDDVAYTLIEAPIGTQLNDATLSWRPTVDQAGDYELVIEARDAFGAASIQRSFVSVFENSPPNISPFDDREITRGQVFRFSPTAADPDGDAVFWSLVDGPPETQVDNYGNIVWPTLGTTTTSAVVTVSAFDTNGASSTASISIDILEDTEGPDIDIQFLQGLTVVDARPIVARGSAYAIRVTAADNVGVTDLVVSVDGVIRTIDESGVVFVSAPNIGNQQIDVVALDAAGNRSEFSQSIDIVDPADANFPGFEATSIPPHPGFIEGDEGDPVVFIDTPLPGDTITGVTPIIGTASDPEGNFWYYRAYLGREDLVSTTSIDLQDPDWTILEQSTDPVIDGQILSLDPAMLSNDVYTVLIAAYDVNGNGFANWTSVNVEGNLTVGNFTLPVTDLSIPLSGIPIEITRVYDTVAAKDGGDFGYGWRMETQDPRLLETAPENTEFIPGSTKVYLSGPDGRRIGFTYEEEPIPLFCHAPDLCIFQGYLGDQQFRPYFKPDPGVYSTLEAEGLGIITRGGLSNGFSLITQALTRRPQVNPSEYTLTTKDGLEYRYQQNKGLKSITDLNGNVVTFSADEIVHSDGEVIRFTRDGRDRIRTITDPAGGVIEYRYDASGNLAEVINQVGLVTKYHYLNDPGHYLDEAIDPLGRTTLKVEYDERGMFVGLFDAVGQSVGSQSFDTSASTGVIRDGRGNETVIEYDDRGNVLIETDPLGHQVRYFYEDPANPDLETRIIAKDGHVTERQFDDRGNLLVEAELGPEGSPFAEPIVTSYTYDSGNRVTSVTDARGNTTSFAYDQDGNLVLLTNALDHESSFTYDADGNVSTFTDFNGNVTVFENYVSGQPTLITYGDGTQQRIEYNIYGQPTFEAYFEPDASIAWQRTRKYDRLGRLVEETLGSDIDGSATKRRLFYDGQLLDWEVLVHPDSIDSEGNLTESPATPITNRHSSIIDYIYDDKNRLIQQIDAEGGVIDFRYDADDNRVALRDPVGNLTTWLYDEVGQPIEERDPLYWDRVRSNDAALTALSDDEFLDLVAPSDGDSVDALFDDPSGASCQTNTGADHVILSCFDEVGNQSAKIDRNGRRSEYNYDFMQNLVEERWYTIDDALVRTLAYGYDSVGNMRSASDPDSQLTYTYNAANQQLTADNAGTANVPRVLLSYDYDPNGNVISVSDDSGVTVASIYNERNLLDVRQWFDADGSELDPLRFNFSYNAAGRTTIVDRFASLDQSNFIGQQLREYDLAGRSTVIDFVNAISESLAFYSFTYEALGRMATSSRAGIDATYAHDLTGQLTSAIRSTGNDEFFSYDLNGNRTIAGYLTGIGNRLATDGTYNYEYDGEGNRISRTEIVTGTVTRYEFDHRNRLIRVTQQDPGSESVEIATYSYDSLDRRTATRQLGEVAASIYDRDQVWLALDQVSRTSERYLYGDDIDTLLAIAAPAKQAAFVNTDQLGSAVGYIGLNEIGTVQFSYASFGQPGPTHAIGQPRFTGREHSPALNLIYYRAREYDPVIGRFLSEDPLGLGPDANTYRYVYNAPLEYVDPFGEAAVGLGVFVRAASLVPTTGTAAVAIRIACILVKAADALRLGPAFVVKPLALACDVLVGPPIKKASPKLRVPPRKPPWRPPNSPPNNPGFRPKPGFPSNTQIRPGTFR